jgi:hypothetical protein
MICNDLPKLNLTSYKRLFVFGCSFTNYIWPTWADLIRTEMPEVEFFNLGKSGAGSQFISSMIVEANQRYTFCETDLIIVQWSTYFREDRYVKSAWETPGNIFTQNMYDDNFIKNFACIRGYIIRDLAIMTAIKIMLTALPCAAVLLTSIPIDVELQVIEPGLNINDVIDLYEDTIESLNPPMSEILRPPGNTSPFPWPTNIRYIDDINGNKLITDYHPSPASYYTYIKKLGFALTEKSFNFANEAETMLKNMKTRSELHIQWSIGAPLSKLL